MTGIMISHQRGSGDVTLGTVSTGGAAVTSIGSKVRDAHATLSLNNEEHWGPSHRAIQVNNKVFILYRDTASKLAISEFSPNAQSLLLAADPAGGGTPTLPTAGLTVTQAVSGATGVLLEDYIASDNYINIKTVTGTFDAVNSCSFSGGTTVTVTPTSVENNGGEFFRRTVGLISNTLSQTSSFTGAHHYLDSNNDLNFATLYMSTSGTFGVTYASATDTFTESASLHSNTFIERMGASVGFKNTIYFWYAQSFNYLIGVYSPESNSVVINFQGSDSGTGTGVFSAKVSVQSSLAIINGRVFENRHRQARWQFSEVTGATTVVKFSTVADNVTDPARAAWCWAGKDDNALYTMFEQDSVVKQVDRFYIDDLGVVQKNTEFNFNPTNRFILDILPAALQNVTNTSAYFFRNNEDDQLNPTFLAHAGAATGDLSQYNLETWTDLDSGQTAIFRNTIGAVNGAGTADVEFVGDVSASLSVGDVIRNNTTNRIYEVAAVSTQYVQIASFLNAGGDATATDSAVSKMTPWTLVAAAPGTAGMAFPADNRGGGGYTYAVGEHTSKLVTRVGLAGKERFTFTLHSDSGSLVVKVSFFYRLDDGVDRQCTVSNPSVGGSLASNEVSGWTADNTTNHELTWDQNTDGVASGAAVEFFIKVDV
jgi:hypothetical protein